MRFLRSKIAMLILCFTFLIFFSNDFGLIDIEKTAIITALAIDMEDSDYVVTAQIAVPEATDQNTENSKAQVSGKGKTVASAIKNIGDVSGWFPKMEFCNLIIVGSDFRTTNIIRILDYFSKTLRIQDSAVVVMAEKKAKEILEVSTPLDNISSFALQKVLLKSPGFDRDVADTDIKTFVVDYYSTASSCIMPLVKIEDQKHVLGGGSESQSGSSGQDLSAGGSSNSSSQSGSNTGNKGNTIFNTKCTALFKDGVYCGELSESETLAYNMIYGNFTGTTLEISGNENPLNTQNQYLLTVKRCNPKLSLCATDFDLTLNISIDLYCKISDQNTVSSDSTYEKNLPLPNEVIDGTVNTVNDWFNSLIQKQKVSGCDFLKVKEKLYRYNHSRYSLYKDNFVSEFKPNISITVSGQK